MLSRTPQHLPPFLGGTPRSIWVLLVGLFNIKFHSNHPPHPKNLSVSEREIPRDAEQHSKDCFWGATGHKKPNPNPQSPFCPPNIKLQFLGLPPKPLRCSLVPPFSGISSEFPAVLEAPCVSFSQLNPQTIQQQQKKSRWDG